MYSITAVKKSMKKKNGFIIDYFVFEMHKQVVDGSIFNSQPQEVSYLFGLLKRVESLSKSSILLYVEDNDKFKKESARVSKLTNDLTVLFTQLPTEVVRAVYPYMSTNSDAKSLKYALFSYLRKKN